MIRIWYHQTHIIIGLLKVHYLISWPLNPQWFFLNRSIYYYHKYFLAVNNKFKNPLPFTIITYTFKYVFSGYDCATKLAPSRKSGSLYQIAFSSGRRQSMCTLNYNQISPFTGPIYQIGWSLGPWKHPKYCSLVTSSAHKPSFLAIQRLISNLAPPESTIALVRVPLTTTIQI